jgi:hypothetical protein
MEDGMKSGRGKGMVGVEVEMQFFETGDMEGGRTQGMDILK